MVMVFSQNFRPQLQRPKVQRSLSDLSELEPNRKRKMYLMGELVCSKILRAWMTLFIGRFRDDVSSLFESNFTSSFKSRPKTKSTTSSTIKSVILLTFVWNMFKSTQFHFQLFPFKGFWESDQDEVESCWEVSVAQYFPTDKCSFEQHDWRWWNLCRRN